MAIIRTFKLSDIYGTGKKLWYKSTNNSAIMCRIIVNPHPKCAILSEQTARMVIETFHALTYTLAKYDATNEIFFTFNLYLMFLTLFSKNSFLDFQKKKWCRTWRFSASMHTIETNAVKNGKTLYFIAAGVHWWMV